MLLWHWIWDLISICGAKTSLAFAEVHCCGMVSKSNNGKIIAECFVPKLTGTVHMLRWECPQLAYESRAPPSGRSTAAGTRPAGGTARSRQGAIRLRP